ncbi:MAG: hypothetical protein A2172_02225 [Candidatus Woykebacteria bacterium RBG_13_40_15]|uniref:DUF3465 domain-containing protein n=1 Tax=Candidatus Woykebacteria bacterium RBG_13_40_15 TaxID=1802593 RepID=A0A1G1W6A0_9BACT|nr:MAG: hypothetical protein A2172_02225 [Candidatus Woykebacteria bacterium RBG_13_40_15]
MTPEEAFEQKLNDVPMTAEGKVIEVLPDDIGETPHQRFVIKLDAGNTILIAHNLERAYRVPVKLGDEVEVHGTYKWNKYGGLIHKTHHDERGEHEDGWINLVGVHHPDFTKPVDAKLA